MWRPGFTFVESVPARLHGAHRALCVWSVAHRGTPEHPGLVLGLDRGGSCRGLAFRIAPESGDSVMAYLRQRELITNVYREAKSCIFLEDRDHTRVTATLYLVDRKHPQYAGMLPPERALEVVRGATGPSGANRDYVVNTVDHLRRLGIRDAQLEWLAEQLRG